MLSQTLSSPLLSCCTGLALSAALSSAAWATDPAAAPASAASTPAATAPAAQAAAKNPDAEKALERHFRTIYWALEGKQKVPPSSSFSDNFNQQISTEQLQQVLAQIHQKLGHCSLAGNLQLPTSYAGGYLLQCETGYVPMDIAVEDSAPYRVHSLVIRPAYVRAR